MKQEWRTLKLGEASSFLNRGGAPKYVERGGIVVLNQKCIRDHRVSFEVARRHDPRAKAVSSDRLVRAGDVLINSTGEGTLGRLAQLREDPPEPTTVDSHVTIVRPAPGLFFRDFFGYALRDIEADLKKSGEGCGGQTELNRSVLAERFLVRFPISLAEQRRIVGMLDETLAGLATAKVNAERNLQNARALFESHLQSVFTRRGRGWVKESVGDLVSEGTLVKPFDGNHGEIHPSKADYTESGVPFIMANNLQNGSVDTKHCAFIARKLADSLRVGFAEDGDVLISHKGTIGRSAVLSTREDYVMLTPQVTAYRVKNHGRLYNRFIRYVFLSREFQREMVALAADGSTRAYVGITKQLALHFRFPDLAEQKRLSSEWAALDLETQRLSDLYRRKLTALEALKKALLHQAFSGELP